MKSLLVIAILIAACGYGAFSHFAAEDLKIAQLEQRKVKATAEAADIEQQIAKIRPESDELKRSLNETQTTIPANELAKARAVLTEKRDGLAKELEAAKIAAEASTQGPDELLWEISELNAQIEATNATIQKIDKENQQLMKYRATEEAAIASSGRSRTNRR